MNKGIFITGTGTDVGKTFVTALIIKKLRNSQINAGYYKAALSGALEVDGILLPGDADYVNRIAHLNDSLDRMVSYVYKEAVSPHLAAKLSCQPVELTQVLMDYHKAQSKYDYIVVEGSGGIICPLRYDECVQLFLEDVIKTLDLETLIIADAGLGTINATVLTVNYLKQQHIGIRGIILNNYTGSLMEKDNQKMIGALTGIPVISLVKPNATEIDFTLTELEDVFL